MAFIRAISTVAAPIVLASLCVSAQQLSCGVPAANETGRRADTVLGHILLQTKTKASAVIVPVNGGMQHENHSVADGVAPDAQGLLDDASLLSVRVGQRSVAGTVEARQTTRVPLGMPGSAASLFTVLQQGAQNPIYIIQGGEEGHFWVKLVIIIILGGLLVLCCTTGGTTLAARHREHRPSKHERLIQAGLTQGRLVQATRTFISDGEVSSEISPGQQAKILKIDEDGDLLVKFDTTKMEQWVRNRKALEVLQPLGDGSPFRTHVETTDADERTDRQAFGGAGHASSGFH